jgi:hypothetical protein
MPLRHACLGQGRKGLCSLAVPGVEGCLGDSPPWRRAVVHTAAAARSPKAIFTREVTDPISTPSTLLIREGLA